MAPTTPSPRLTVPNVTMASVPITVLLYDGPLLYGFNVAIKQLKNQHREGLYMTYQQSIKLMHTLQLTDCC